MRITFQLQSCSFWCADGFDESVMRMILINAPCLTSSTGSSREQNNILHTPATVLLIFWRKPLANAINCVWMETSIKLLELSACRAEAAYGSERDHSKWNLLFDYNFRLNEEKKDFALHAQRVLKSLVGSFPIWCYRVFKMSQPLNEAW